MLLPFGLYPVCGLDDVLDVEVVAVEGPDAVVTFVIAAENLDQLVRRRPGFAVAAGLARARGQKPRSCLSLPFAFLYRGL